MNKNFNTMEPKYHLTQMSRGNFLKKIGFASVAAGMVLSRCKKDDDDDDKSDNGLKSGQIEIKASLTDPSNENEFAFYAAAKKITIDWGDGTIEKFTPNGADNYFYHKYPYNINPTITIETVSITSLDFNPRNTVEACWGNAKELRFGKCTELKEVRCRSYDLSILDIKNAVASLEHLSIDVGKLLSLDVSGASKLKIMTTRIFS